MEGALLMLKQSVRQGTEKRMPVWVGLVVILGALLFLVGAVLSKVNPTLLTNNSPMTDAARVYADYTFARDLAIAVVLLLLLLVRARRILAGVMVLVALIQLMDIMNDLARGTLILLPGLLLFAVVFLIGARQVFGRPLWQAATWRDAG
jgi:hypothetical protein